LAAEAQAFAERLSNTVSEFLGRSCPFTADAIPSGRFSVTDQEAAGITLTVGGMQVLSLEISYECSWDTSGDYLAVHTSKVAVHAGPRPTGKQVLFRYEYVRDQGRDLPSAHLHVHAHRDAFAHVISTAGRNAADAKAKLNCVLGEVPQLSAPWRQRAARLHRGEREVARTDEARWRRARRSGERPLERCESRGEGAVPTARPGDDLVRRARYGELSILLARRPVEAQFLEPNLGPLSQKLHAPTGAEWPWSNRLLPDCLDISSQSSGASKGLSAEHARDPD
jgi:hypothetical protein